MEAREGAFTYMPLVELMWRPDRVDEATAVRVRDAVCRQVASAFSQFDPRHEVTLDMVDARLRMIGPLDVLHRDLLVSVLARDERRRRRHSRSIAALVTEAVEREAPGVDAMVEVILNQRTSLYVYEEPRR